MTEVLIRRDLGTRPYRLRCRFTIDAHPSKRSLEKAGYASAKMFIRDMKLQGFEYMDRYGFEMTGPYPAIATITVPKRSRQKWHLPSKELMAAVAAGYRPSNPGNGNGVQTVPLINETDRWDFELSAVFLHDTILTELPEKEAP
jgi:hypothetical protein